MISEDGQHYKAGEESGIVVTVQFFILNQMLWLIRG